MVRLSRGGNPEFTRKGFHPTAICAPFGTAATASLLLGHNLLKTQNALCLAALGSSGLISSFKCGPTQPLQVAWAVRSGIVAAMMAGAGHPGYSEVFEEGFYPAYLGHEPDPPVNQPLEHEYAIKGSYLKPYPGCRHIHPSIDAFGQILKEHSIDPSQIEKIYVETYKIAVETEIHTLKNRGDAYFNIPYALAARAVLGRNDWDSFDEKHFDHERIIKNMKKIKVHIDPEIESLYPHQRGSVVKVHTVDGSILCSRVDHPLGEPENPLPASAIREKFRNLAGAFLSKKSMDGIENILDVSRPVEHSKDLFEIVRKMK
jgi:2-methylcitrate dehydratase PrpD